MPWVALRGVILWSLLGLGCDPGVPGGRTGPEDPPVASDPCAGDTAAPTVRLDPGSALTLPEGATEATLTFTFDTPVQILVPASVTADGGARVDVVADALQIVAHIEGLVPGDTTVRVRLHVADACGNALDYANVIGIRVEEPVPEPPAPESPCPGPAGAEDFVFADVTACAGLEGSVHVLYPNYFITGQAWGDFDGDGWQDLYLTDTEGPNRLYRNRGDGTFELAAPSASVSAPGQRSGGAVFVDFDNDGFKDLYVAGLPGNLLFRNDEGRDFIDVTEAAGVEGYGKSESATFGDYDGDGWLDLYVANWHCDVYCPNVQEPSLDLLYHNEGDGTFTDSSALLGTLERTGMGFIATFTDFDDDGDPDIYLLNDKGTPGPPPPGGPMNRNILWRNDGPGCDGWCFTEVGREVGADARMSAMGVAVGDYDADGDLDFYVSDVGSSKLLNNGGVEGFVDQAAAAGVDRPVVGWGTVFFDYDNDGWSDLFLAVSEDAQYWEPPFNRLFQNAADGTFVDRSPATAGGIPATTYGVNAADYDADGGLDLIIGDRGVGYRLLRNLDAARTGHRWIRLRLQGDGPVNRDAVGARVILEGSDGRTQMQEVTLGSSLGGNNDLALHFGLGTATPAHATVLWPDGTRQDLPAPAPDREHLVVYGR